MKEKDRKQLDKAAKARLKMGKGDSRAPIPMPSKADLKRKFRMEIDPNGKPRMVEVE